MRKLTIMVSSTCFDLKHVRAELAGYIEALGHAAVLSEQGTFPVDPNRTTIANCIDVVNSDADILLLIVGHRYGSTVPGGKSITNLEYEAARIKGIPIYVFVEQEILTLLRVYEDNPSVTLSGVDNPVKLFEFVRTLQQRDQVWCFPFTKVAELCETLKSQLSLLFFTSLSMRQKLRDPSTDWMRSLSPRLTLLLTSQTDGFEQRFLLEATLEAVEAHKAKRWLLQHDIAFEPVSNAGDTTVEISHWMHATLAEIQAMVAIVERQFDSAVQEAMRPSGIPADPHQLYILAQSIGTLYERLLSIAGSIVVADIPSELESLRTFLKGAVISIIEDIESFLPEAISRLDEALTRVATGEGQVMLTLTLSLTDYFGPREHELQEIIDTMHAQGDSPY